MLNFKNGARDIRNKKHKRDGAYKAKKSSRPHGLYRPDRPYACIAPRAQSLSLMRSTMSISLALATLLLAGRGTTGLARASPPPAPPTEAGTAARHPATMSAADRLLCEGPAAGGAGAAGAAGGDEPKTARRRRERGESARGWGRSRTGRASTRAWALGGGGGGGEGGSNILRRTVAGRGRRSAGMTTVGAGRAGRGG